EFGGEAGSGPPARTHAAVLAAHAHPAGRGGPALPAGTARTRLLRGARGRAAPAGGRHGLHPAAGRRSGTAPVAAVAAYRPRTARAGNGAAAAERGPALGDGPAERGRPRPERGRADDGAPAVNPRS